MDYTSIKSSQGSWDDKLNIVSILDECQSDEAKLNTFFNCHDLRQTMLKLYKIVPTMLTTDVISCFLAEVQTNEDYKAYVEEWNSLKTSKK